MAQNQINPFKRAMHALSVSPTHSIVKRKKKRNRDKSGEKGKKNGEVKLNEERQGVNAQGITNSQQDGPPCLITLIPFCSFGGKCLSDWDINLVQFVFSQCQNGSLQFLLIIFNSHL
jgi:hypothetical protein